MHLPNSNKIIIFSMLFITNSLLFNSMTLPLLCENYFTVYVFGGHLEMVERSLKQYEMISISLILKKLPTKIV